MEVASFFCNCDCRIVQHFITLFAMTKKDITDSGIKLLKKIKLKLKLRKRRLLRFARNDKK